MTPNGGDNAGESVPRKEISSKKTKLTITQRVSHFVSYKTVKRLEGEFLLSGTSKPDLTNILPGQLLQLLLLAQALKDVSLCWACCKILLRRAV